ncbi:hypothetical protein MTO96_020481 [Rhipicephalus appendiculatus]
MSVAAEGASLPSSPARSPDFARTPGAATRQRKVLRVARSVDSATAASHNTMVVPTGIVRVYRKQAHTLSARGGPESSSEDEGMICRAMPAPRSASRSPTQEGPVAHPGSPVAHPPATPRLVARPVPGRQSRLPCPWWP